MVTTFTGSLLYTLGILCVQVKILHTEARSRDQILLYGKPRINILIHFWGRGWGTLFNPPPPPPPQTFSVLFCPPPPL